MSIMCSILHIYLSNTDVHHAKDHNEKLSRTT